MPKQVFTPEMERAVMEEYVAVWTTDCEGFPKRSREKHELIASNVNKRGEKDGWYKITGLHVERKLDSIRRKGRKIYQQCKKRTRRGPPIPEDFDITVSVVESGIFFFV